MRVVNKYNNETIEIKNLNALGYASPTLQCNVFVLDK